MRRLVLCAVLLFLAGVFVVGCSRPPQASSLKVGTPVTVTLKDGSAVSGRVVEANAEQLVVDPFEGGEWKTVPRGQVASVKQTDAGNISGTPGAPLNGGQVAAAEPPEGRSQPSEGDGIAGNGNAGNRAAGSGGHRTTARHGAPRDEARPTPAPRPAFREVTVPASTLLHVRLEDPVASDTSHAEDRVRASLARAVMVDGEEVLPAGSELRGVVTDAQRSGKVKGRAGVAFRFDRLQAEGQEYRVRTQGVERLAPATKRNDAMKIGIPAAGGAILGGILGGKKGAVIGGAAGGGAGTAVVLTTPGKELRLPAGTALTVRLLEPVTIRVPLAH